MMATLWRHSFEREDVVYTLDTLGTMKVNMERHWTPRGQSG